MSGEVSCPVSAMRQLTLMLDLVDVIAGIGNEVVQRSGVYKDSLPGCRGWH